MLSLASLSADAIAKPVAGCFAPSERTVHEYTNLSATDLEAPGERPELCWALGAPLEIVFEVVLPAELNRRIVIRSDGGYVGNSPDNPGSRGASERTVPNGLGSVHANTGHDRAAEPLGTLAFNNRQKEIDYSFRAVRLTLQPAKELVGIYYGEPRWCFSRGIITLCNIDRLTGWVR